MRGGETVMGHYLGRWVLGAMLLASTGLAGAAIVHSELPDSYPKEFDQKGRIDSIHQQERRIVVDDRSFGLDHSIDIVLPAYPAGAIRQLEEGMAIGFNTRAGSDREYLWITDLWVLPEEAVKEERPQGLGEDDNDGAGILIR